MSYKQQILDEIIVNYETLEEETMEYVSKEEVSETVKIKQMNGIRVAERYTRKRNPNTKKRIANMRKEIQLQKEIEREKQEKEIQIN